jgi:hypothetical protein
MAGVGFSLGSPSSPRSANQFRSSQDSRPVPGQQGLLELRKLAAISAPYGIPSPGNDPSFQPGGKYASDISVASPKYLVVAVGW